MNPARGSQGRHNPTQPSIFAAESLSPAYPQRAAWGTSGSLRAWQAAALKTYMTDMPEDFLAVATPGAGKTTFALRVATELLAAGDVHQVTVVCPTEHLKYQWAEAAARVGMLNTILTFIKNCQFRTILVCYTKATVSKDFFLCNSQSLITSILV